MSCPDSDSVMFSHLEPGERQRMTRLAAQPVHSGHCPGLCLMTITKYNEALKLSPATGSRPRKVKASTSGSIRGGSCSCVRGGEGPGMTHLADQEEDVCCLCVARAVCLLLIVRNGMRGVGEGASPEYLTRRNIRKEISR